MKTIICYLICIAGLISCTATRIKSTEAAPGFNLTNYKTFNFYEISANGEAADETYNSRVNLLKNSIQEQLTAKGLVLNPNNPDLLVNIGVVTTEKVQTRQTNFREDAPRYIGQRRYTWKSQEVEVARYKEGTVTVDLVDPQKNEMVWKGTGVAVIPKDESKLRETIEEGVAKLFKDF